MGLPFEEEVNFAHERALNQGIDILFHVYFKTESDLSPSGISAERTSVIIGETLCEVYHADLSLTDMMYLLMWANDAYFCLCDCGSYDQKHEPVKLWWNTPAD